MADVGLGQFLYSKYRGSLIRQNQVRTVFPLSISLD